MVTIKRNKTWESVFFTAEENGVSATVELELNHETTKWQICTEGQEHVSFNDDLVKEGELRVHALYEAVQYVKQQFDK